MALHISEEVLQKEGIKLRKDKRGEIIRIDFPEATNTEIVVDDGKNLTFVRDIPEAEHISSWASHINIYDMHNKKPALKSSFWKCRKAKSPDKMRATADITETEDGTVRITVQKNQYKFKRNKTKPFSYEEEFDPDEI